MTKNKSYSEILRASSVMGGAEVISTLIGLVRTKLVAVLIGPFGIGLVANFQAIQGIISTIARLGVDASAVRSIADASSKNDQHALSESISTIRRICWITGVFGALLIAAFAIPLSRLTFGSENRAIEISLLSLTIFFGSLQGGHIAILQGMRRIDDLARITVIRSVIGSITSVGFYAWLGVRGIIPALSLLALIQFCASSYFARRINVSHVEVTWQEFFQRGLAMIRLGLAFMWNGIMLSVVAYLTFALITREIGVDASGIYSAALVLSGLFTNFILNAMSTDYYPRLTSSAQDSSAMVKLVNEQTEIGLLLAVPGLLATLSLSHWIIAIFYTEQFAPASDLLQWLILGCLGRVVGFPMGYIVPALGKSMWFASTETFFNLIHLCLIWAGLQVFGLEGVSIAFFASTFFGVIFLYYFTHHIIGFSWTRRTFRLFVVLTPIVGVTFLSGRLFPLWLGTIFGFVTTSISSILCVRALIERTGVDHPIVRAVFRVPGMRSACGL